MASTFEFNENKQYMALAQDLRAIAVERKQEAVVSLIDRALGEFSKGTFSLAILGMVKRGKSTLCNALLGADCEKYAPVGKTPVSNAISVFEKGEDSVSVEYLDGRRENVTIEDIPQFITEQLNPGNKKNVSCLHIKSSFPRLPEGVSLVDTPGEGSFNAHHDDILYKYLPSADAAIFLIDVFAPLTESELDFLKEIMGNDVKKLFFAMNRTDRADQDEIDAAIEHNLKALADIGLNVAKIYPISAKKALNGDWESSGLAELFSDVEKFLSVEKFRVPRLRFMHRIMPIIAPLMNGIATEIDARTKTATELEQEITKLTAQGEEKEARQESSIVSFRETWDAASAEFFTGIRNSIRALEMPYRNRIKSLSVIGFKNKQRAIMDDLDCSIRQAFNENIDTFNKKIDDNITALPIQYGGIASADGISGMSTGMVSRPKGRLEAIVGLVGAGVGFGLVASGAGIIIGPVMAGMGCGLVNNAIESSKSHMCNSLVNILKTASDFWESQRQSLEAERDKLIAALSEQFQLQMSPTVQALQDALESQGKIDVQYDERLRMLASMIGSIRERADDLIKSLEEHP